MNYLLSPANTLATVAFVSAQLPEGGYWGTSGYAPRAVRQGLVRRGLVEVRRNRRGDATGVRITAKGRRVNQRSLWAYRFEVVEYTLAK